MKSKTKEPLWIKRKNQLKWMHNLKFRRLYEDETTIVTLGDIVSLVKDNECYVDVEIDPYTLYGVMPEIYVYGSELRHSYRMCWMNYRPSITKSELRSISRGINKIGKSMFPNDNERKIIREIIHSLLDMPGPIKGTDFHKRETGVSDFWKNRDKIEGKNIKEYPVRLQQTLFSLSQYAEDLIEYGMLHVPSDMPHQGTLLEIHQYFDNIGKNTSVGFNEDSMAVIDVHTDGFNELCYVEIYPGYFKDKSNVQKIQIKLPS